MALAAFYSAAAAPEGWRCIKGTLPHQLETSPHLGLQRGALLKGGAASPQNTWKLGQSTGHL